MSEEVLLWWDGPLQPEECVVLHAGLPQVFTGPVVHHVETQQCLPGLVLFTGRTTQSESCPSQHPHCLYGQLDGSDFNAEIFSSILSTLNLMFSISLKISVDAITNELPLQIKRREATAPSYNEKPQKPIPAVNNGSCERD